MTRTTQAYTRNTAPDPQPLPNRLARLVVEARWFLLAGATLYLILIFLSYSTLDPGWSHANVVPRLHNWGGRVGAWLADLLLYIFGFSAWWWCVAMVFALWRGYRQLSNRFLHPKETEAPHRHEGAIRGAGFALLLVGSLGLEYVRMYSLKAQLPRAPGGVLGELIGGAAQNALGFTGSTLLLLLLFGLGFSLFFHVSWLAVAESIGGALERGVLAVIHLRDARQDRKVGQEAAVKRETVVVQERAKTIEAPPVRIEPQVVTVPRSERVEKEKQVSLFTDLPDTNLPPLSLLDEPPATQETVSVETLEFTSRLIEKKLSDFGIEVKVVAAYPGPV
ncbi:MAG: DNA translocase FtsK 4TM domain-containing protein, partial [Burkholderiaceae bacterium]